MPKFCKTCGCEIPQLRVEFLEKTKSPMTCVKHSQAERVAGYNVRGHKGTGELVVTSQETANQYYKAAERANGIVTAGVRMRKGRS